MNQVGDTVHIDKAEMTGPVDVGQEVKQTRKASFMVDGDTFVAPVVRIDEIRDDEYLGTIVRFEHPSD